MIVDFKGTGKKNDGMESFNVGYSFDPSLDLQASHFCNFNLSTLPSPRPVPSPGGWRRGPTGMTYYLTIKYSHLIQSLDLSATVRESLGAVARRARALVAQGRAPPVTGKATLG